MSIYEYKYLLKVAICYTHCEVSSKIGPLYVPPKNIMFSDGLASDSR